MAAPSAAQSATRPLVIERDDHLCIYCGRLGKNVHEIIPRSAFGKHGRQVCFEVKNRCVVCVKCHALCHNWEWRQLALLILQQRHGYEYPEARYRAVLDRGDTITGQGKGDVWQRKTR